jgi:predicted nucleotidyltransferase
VSAPLTSEVDLLAPPDDAAVQRAIDRFGKSMQERYGHRLRGIFLFGSRARGDSTPFSDVDVAVIIDDSAGQLSETKALAGIAYDVFLETGAEIQPWIFREAEWQDPEHSASPGLLKSVKRDARAVWASRW